MGPMDVSDRLAGRFDASRPRLRAMAYRMLGSLTDADNAVQEGWLHAAGRRRRGRRGQPGGVVHHHRGPGVPGHAALAQVPAGGAAGSGFATRRWPGMSRARSRRRCWPTRSGSRCWSCSTRSRPPNGWRSCCTTRSACRSARSPPSPAGRRMRLASWPAGAVAGYQGTGPDTDPAAGARLVRQRQVAEAFMTASRGGDLEGLIAVLDPDVVLHSDATASPSSTPLTVHGAAAVDGGARAASARSRYGRVALVNGAPGPGHGAARAARQSRWPSPSRARRSAGIDVDRRPGPAGRARRRPA